MPKFLKKIDAVGQKLGKWTVLDDTKASWAVRCECGFQKSVRRDYLIRGLSKCCMSCAQKKHGMEGSKIYNVWAGMIQRCTNVKHRFYHRYGGRGIKVCKEWASSFEKFYADMGEKPKNQTLDRIDNDGDYTVENCRWATVKQQIRNRQVSPRVEFRGEIRPLGDLAQEFNVKTRLLYARIREGWDIEKALTTPSRKAKK